MNENLALNLTRSAQAYPIRPALLFGDTAITYLELDAVTARVAAWLRGRGVTEGDPVGLMLPNVPEFAIAYYAILRAGGIVVPMNVLETEQEVALHLRDASAALLLAWHELAAPAQAGAAEAGVQCVIVDPGSLSAVPVKGGSRPVMSTRAHDDVAVVVYASGTSGQSHGALLTHTTLRRNAEVAADELVQIGPDDVVLDVLPLFEAFAQTCAMNAALAAGSALALVPRPDPETVLEAIERHRVTAFAGEATIYAALLHHDGRERHDTSTLRCCAAGGTTPPVEVVRGFQKAFGCTVLGTVTT